MRFLPQALQAAILVCAVAGMQFVAASSGAQSGCRNVTKQSLAQLAPKDWESLHRLFKKFGACEEEGVAEQFSEDVAQLLMKQWNHLEQLTRLAATDPAFEIFVLRHIDARLDESELLMIVNAAGSHCPAGQQRICALIHARAQESLDVQRDIGQ